MKITHILEKVNPKYMPKVMAIIKVYRIIAKIILFLLTMVFLLSLYNLLEALIIHGRFDSKPVITATIIAVVNVLIIIYVYFDLKSTKLKKSS